MFKLFPLGFPGGSAGKAAACNAGDPGSIPGMGRSSGEGNGNPLQYSCLENPMDRGAWQATVPGVSQSQTQLSELQQQEQFYRLIFLLPSVEVGGALRLLCLV